MNLFEHPGYEKLKSEIEQLVGRIEDILDLYRQQWSERFFELDFDFFIKISEALDLSLEILNSSIKSRYENFDKFMSVVRHFSNEFFEFNESDYETYFILEIQRPLLLKKQQIIEVQEHIKKIVK